MNLTFHILRLLLGALAFYAAAFVREDEEGGVQDRLQEWWLKLMYKRDSALSKATIFMRGIAQLANEAFDAFLGEKLWSLQAVGVSLWFSLAAGCLTLLIVPHLPLAIPPTPVPSVYWLYAAAFASLGLLPYVAGRALAFLIWGVCVAWFLPSLVILAFVINKAWGYVSMLRFVGTLLLIFGLSFAFDVLYVFATRWMLRKVSEMKRVYEIVGLLVFDALLALVLVYGPIEGAWMMMKSPHLTKSGIWTFSVLILNFGEIFACSVFFVLMVFMLLHRLLWPILERPIYALQRYGLIRQKAWLWVIGCGLWFGPSGLEGLKSIMDKF